MLTTPKLPLPLMTIPVPIPVRVMLLPGTMVESTNAVMMAAVWHQSSALIVTTMNAH